MTDDLKDLVAPILRSAEIYQERALKAESLLSEIVNRPWFMRWGFKRRALDLLEDTQKSNPLKWKISKEITDQEMEARGFERIMCSFKGRKIWVKGEYIVPHIDIKGDLFSYDPAERMITYNPSFYKKKVCDVTDITDFCRFFSQ
jgi:hypothetical protein